VVGRVSGRAATQQKVDAVDGPEVVKPGVEEERNQNHVVDLEHHCQNEQPELFVVGAREAQQQRYQERDQVAREKVDQGGKDGRPD
jgi:hypothetical protein